MCVKTTRLLAMVALVAAIVGLGTPVMAQEYTGRIDVTAVDTTGGRLPGVTVDLSGQMIQSAVTDARGEAHFLNLTVGNYTVKATLTGFNEWKSAPLLVTAGGSIALNVKMSVAGAKETVVVTAEAPVLDTKKDTTGASVNFEELQNVPTARDPWVVMQSVPGIVMDRVNIGGNESGQQSGFISKGAGSGDTTWNVDGMPVTDMSSLSSPFYFDFDMFQEMSFTTGGADAKSATGGVQLNMMLKSGTNSFHGQAKGYFEEPERWSWMQANNMPAWLATQLGSKTGKGDHTLSFEDWGGDVGGPVFKDRWWFWGAYGHQNIRIQRMTGVLDKTVLKNVSFKTNAQITKSIRASFTYFNANKLKWGRNTGQTCDQNCGENQTGPNDLYKGEINYNYGSNLFLVARYAHVKGGFAFHPQGGDDSLSYWDVNGVQHGSSYVYITNRPQDSFIVDGNYFKGNHELKFGYTWRKATTDSATTWGQGYYSVAADWGNTTCTWGVNGCMFVQVMPGAYSAVKANYQSFYLSDTISLKRLTIDAGIRFDHQVASVLPVTMPASTIPNTPTQYVLPSVTAPGVDGALKFNLLQPRVGLNYSVNDKTQFRASYSMFTSQISTGAAGFLSVAQYRWFYLDCFDANQDGICSPSEFDWNSYATTAHNYFGGFDINNPTAVATPIHQVGDYGVPRTHEIIVGIDHELMPNLAVSASATYRRNQDYNWRPIRQLTGNSINGVIDGTDYALKGYYSGALPANIPGSPGGVYSVPYYGLADGVTYPSSKGTIFQSRPDYGQSYKGIEATLTKRMSNHWMARVGFSTNSWREYFDQPDGRGNPTPTLGGPNVDGGYVVSAAGGSGKSNIYMVQPSYQLNANGAYQFPFDIDFGVNYQLRQGYPMPWWKYSGGAGACSTTPFGTPTSGTCTDVLGSNKQMLQVYPDFGLARLPAISIVDFRIGKRQKLSHGVILNFDFDIFNAFNAAQVLGRNYNTGSPIGTTIQEITQPRIYRFGLRIQF